MDEIETLIAELEVGLQGLNAEEAVYHKDMKARKRLVADQIEKLRSELKISKLADTLTDEDKAALRQHLELPAVEG